MCLPCVDAAARRVDGVRVDAVRSRGSLDMPGFSHGSGWRGSYVDSVAAAKKLASVLQAASTIIYSAIFTQKAGQSERKSRRIA